VIRPGVPAPNLAPRLGQEDLLHRGEVAYRELRARSLLNRCDSERMPFEWTVNPYRGCAMGCRYCYAAYTHEFLGVETPEAFHRLVYVKRAGLQETAARLQAVVRRGERIALGAATDPYQPGEAQEQVTRRFLELVAQHRGVRIGLITKGALVLRDLDLLRRIHERSSLTVSVSLISLREDLLRRLEPWAPPPIVRLEVLRRLAAAGLDAGISIAPVLPALTDREDDLDALLARAASVGLRRYHWQLLFLRSPTREKYLRWLEAEFPRYLEAYRRAYSHRVYLGGAYKQRIATLMERLAARHGFATGRDTSASRWPRPPEQLRLGPFAGP
jgi:DNA repair photolyase